MAKLFSCFFLILSISCSIVGCGPTKQAEKIEAVSEVTFPHLSSEEFQKKLSVRFHEHEYINGVCTCGRFTAIDEDDQCIILTDTILDELGYTGNNIELPSRLVYQGTEYEVKGIGTCAFMQDKSLISLTLPERATYIGDHAFDGCENLYRVVLPDSITYIGEAAFQCCYSLNDITIPSNVRYIGDFAYNHCPNAQNTMIQLPDSLQSIGNNPDTPSHAFYDCGTDNFTDFFVADTNEFYKSEDGVLYTKDGKTLVAIPVGRKFENGVYEMPNSVTGIGELAFSRNRNITSVIISDNLVIDPEMDQEKKASYVNEGTDLAVGIYGYSSVSEYLTYDTNDRYVSNEGILYSKNMESIIAIPSQYSGVINIPDGVKTWEKDALWTEIDYFKDIAFNKISSIIIPASLESIDPEQIDTVNLLAKYYGTTFSVDADNTSYYVGEDGLLYHF
ncbi:leucine-rich repeat domain-containing protein [Ruminococcus sp. CLA-AA-H200]|uniref:Leucine-rich repeat domain-containing protein n=1 Tax=Ruminococcus turbiniformis TaxID=2881258 RepID=A0ABS8FYE9_9FIRM|nr:leucine-rich repeat domain-containing protein [Ruminococcus turbiniformis]MCC2254619.1 leucine-rich repeat domain-containing protein [Ruminococcus turbiniformis]